MLEDNFIYILLLAGVGCLAVSILLLIMPRSYREKIIRFNKNELERGLGKWVGRFYGGTLNKEYLDKEARYERIIAVVILLIAIVLILYCLFKI